VRASLVLVVLALAACGDPPVIRPKIDGGWKGTYECGADSKKVSAIWDEDDEGNLDGEMFIDFQIQFFGNPILLTARADVKSGDVDEGNYSGIADVLDNATAGVPDFSFDLDMNDDADELDGTMDKLNGEGASTETCDAHLERTTGD
jgi:hypothetical protein